MAHDKTPLVWIDMEMSGLVPDRDRILEVAMIVTDADLNTLVEAPVMVIHQADAVLEAMDSWNKATHGKSGLVEKVKASTMTEGEAESKVMVEFDRDSRSTQLRYLMALTFILADFAKAETRLS